MVGLDRLTNLQGNLKTLEEGEYQKLKKQILENGFSFAIHAWEEPEEDPGKIPHLHILDGHQRCEALRRLRDEGYDVGLAPVILVKAESKAQAVKKLLGAASQFGTFHVEQVGALAEIAGIGMADVAEISAIPGLKVEGLGEVKAEEEKTEFDEVPVDRENYQQGNIRQIVLYYPVEQYEAVVQKALSAMDRLQCQDNSELFVKLLEIANAQA